MKITHLNYNFSSSSNPFIEIIDRAFFTATGANCSDKGLHHIFGNALGSTDAWLGLEGLKSANRQDVINALSVERVELLQKMQGLPEFDFREKANHQYLVDTVRLGCFDKFTELLLGKVLAAQIVRDTDQEIAQQTLSPNM